jgi:uncharacterized membrane protein (DUF4010 family)
VDTDTIGQTSASFPPFDVATRILVAVGCGLLVGLERQWAHKELGSRTFPIVSLLGALAALISTGFVVAGFAGIVALIVVSGVRDLVLRGAAEITTSAALMVTFALGVLAGEGHVFTPAAAVILMTLMLSLKPQLSRFAVGLSEEEVRGAVLLSLIAFVIYPVLPDRFIDPWMVFNPREAWLIIVLISAIGFVNYVLLRLFSTRGLYYTAIFGGLVNSTAAIAELSTLLRDAGDNAAPQAITVNLLTIVSMFARNLALLAMISFRAGLLALWPILAMMCAAAILAVRQQVAADASPPLRLRSPLELRKVASFGRLFVAIQCAGSLGSEVARFLGHRRGKSGRRTREQRQFDGRCRHARRPWPHRSPRGRCLFGIGLHCQHVGKSANFVSSVPRSAAHPQTGPPIGRHRAAGRSHHGRGRLHRMKLKVVVGAAFEVRTQAGRYRLLRRAAL